MSLETKKKIRYNLINFKMSEIRQSRSCELFGSSRSWSRSESERHSTGQASWRGARSSSARSEKHLALLVRLHLFQTASFVFDDDREEKNREGGGEHPEERSRPFVDRFASVTCALGHCARHFSYWFREHFRETPQSLGQCLVFEFVRIEAILYIYFYNLTNFIGNRLF